MRARLRRGREVLRRSDGVRAESQRALDGLKGEFEALTRELTAEGGAAAASWSAASSSLPHGARLPVVLGSLACQPGSCVCPQTACVCPPTSAPPAHAAVHTSFSPPALRCCFCSSHKLSIRPSAPVHCGLVHNSLCVSVCLPKCFACLI